MSLPRVVTHEERPDLHARWAEVVRPAWPEFMLHDPVCDRHWGSLYTTFPGFQLYLYDETNDTVLGEGNTIPLAWNGTAAGLPDGLDPVLVRGVTEAEQGIRPSSLCALQAVITPGRQGQGLSRVIIQGMRDIARHHALTDLIAPVRPTMKSRYPLTDMARYIRWQRDDGLPLDPWLRVHRRLGAEIIGVAERSMTITGTVEEWERWTDMAFPESGEYVVPGALVPVRIDRQHDQGTYVEPNVWMRHRVSASGPGSR